MKVFLDIDGVLADWVGGIHKRLGIDFNYNQWPYANGPNGWSFHNEIGLSIQDISDLCDTDLWAGLDWTHDGRDILRAVLSAADAADVYLLTAPMQHPESATGKTLWVRKHLPLYGKRLIITLAPKAIFAQVPDSVLVDDSSKNVREWTDAGGRAILVPRPWNDLYSKSDMSTASVEKDLAGLVGENV